MSFGIAACLAFTCQRVVRKRAKKRDKFKKIVFHNAFAGHVAEKFVIIVNKNLNKTKSTAKIWFLHLDTVRHVPGIHKCTQSCCSMPNLMSNLNAWLVGTTGALLKSIAGIWKFWKY